jgi:hemerythrin superfamily protein
MNVLKLLKNDHDAVRSLFARFEDTGKNSLDKKQQLSDEIRRELLVHTKAEEEIFYPGVKAVDDEGRKLISEAVKEHKDVDELLTEIAKLKPRDKAFGEKMEALMEMVDHHVEVEEGRIFQFAEENCPEDQLERMAEEIEARKKILERQWAA